MSDDPATDAVYDMAAIAQRHADRAEALGAIARDLAETDPTVHTPDLPHGHNWCTLCRVWLPIRPAPPERHEPECPWRRAVEWTTQEENK